MNTAPTGVLHQLPACFLPTPLLFLHSLESFSHSDQLGISSLYQRYQQGNREERQQQVDAGETGLGLRIQVRMRENKNPFLVRDFRCLFSCFILVSLYVVRYKKPAAPKERNTQNPPSFLPAIIILPAHPLSLLVLYLFSAVSFCSRFSLSHSDQQPLPPPDIITSRISNCVITDSSQIPLSLCESTGVFPCVPSGICPTQQIVYLRKCSTNSE